MEIRIEDIEDGMIVDRPIRTENNKAIILNRGAMLNNAIIEKLDRIGIKYIDVALTQEQELALEADKGVNATIPNQLTKEIEEAVKTFNMSKLVDCAKTLVQTILKNPDFKYDLADYKDKRDLISHCIRTASFSVLVADYYNDTLNDFISNIAIRGKCKIDLESLAVASILHDIGKLCKDKNILDKIIASQGSLSNFFPEIQNINLSEYNDKYASIYSYLLLKDNNSLTPDNKITILLSNEAENGSGPLKPPLSYLTSRQNFVYASKIIKLCSMYDEELEKAIVCKQPLENILAKLDYSASNGILNKELEKLFIEYVPIYSPGSKVKLSDGRYAIVEQSFIGRIYMCKPIVRTIPENELIDLREQTSLTIQEICGNETSFLKIANEHVPTSNQEIGVQQKR